MLTHIITTNTNTVILYVVAASIGIGTASTLTYALLEFSAKKLKHVWQRII